MGLDMYLSASRYIGGWNHTPPVEKDLFTKLTLLLNTTPTTDSPSFTVSATVGYWRKANAIHKWFVAHVQDGTDDCKEYDVSRDQLTTLRDLCLQVLNTAQLEDAPIANGTQYSGGTTTQLTRPGQRITNPDAIAALLPTTPGFFFGKEDYDSDYLDDIRHTHDLLTSLLDNPNLQGWYFTYRSSW